MQAARLVKPEETSIARFAEEELIKAGRLAEAFNQYALLANQANTHLATFRALAKKHPEVAKHQLLNHQNLSNNQNLKFNLKNGF